MTKSTKRAQSPEALEFRRGIAERLRLIFATMRDEDGRLLQQNEIAALIGEKGPKVGNWVANTTPQLPSVEPMIELCKRTGCTLDYIYRDEPDGNSARLTNLIKEVETEIAAPSKRKAPAGQVRERPSSRRIAS